MVIKKEYKYTSVLDQYKEEQIAMNKHMSKLCAIVNDPNFVLYTPTRKDKIKTYLTNRWNDFIDNIHERLLIL